VKVTLLYLHLVLDPHLIVILLYVGHPSPFSRCKAILGVGSDTFPLIKEVPTYNRGSKEKGNG